MARLWPDAPIGIGQGWPQNCCGSHGKEHRGRYDSEYIENTGTVHNHVAHSSKLLLSSTPPLVGLNYIAVCRCLSASPQAVAAGLVVDNLFALIYFPATSALSSGLPDVKDGPAILKDSLVSAGKQMKGATTHTSNTVFQICNLLFLSSSLLWFGEKVGGAAGALPCCTLLTLLFAVTAPKRWMQDLQKPAEMLGTACLYLFFATAGAPGIAIADSVRNALFPLSLFLSCLYGIHFFILWSLYKIGGNRVPCFLAQRLLVASSAAIGGPATSVALASANNWRSLVVPSLLVGNIGYAIATFCGIGFAKVFAGI
jgi:hypothetical protein